MEKIRLPIADFKEEIIKTVAQNSVTIIVAQTGAGKTTQVPQYLLQEGYNIVVTQPRRLAARTVAARVAEEMSVKLGDLVGFRTGQERKDSSNTRCLFATDGLALVRELMGQGKHQVLVIDEVHEWNLNIEVLVAWVKKIQKENPNFKVVLMSATLESERLSAFFDNAPIIDVPGRLFPVEEIAPQGAEMIDDVVSLIRRGRNVLVFQPGKAEITEMILKLEEMRAAGMLNAEILPLHGELSVEEQAKCFNSYGRPKVVVSTNVAQTSVTISDIDAVVDSGMVKQTEVVDGVQGLYLRAISYADREQRKGRAGRCKPGIFIDWCSETNRSEFPVAEINRSLLDQMVLRLAEAGFDMEALEFFHQPDKAEIHKAHVSLRVLGCLDEKNKVTPIGHKVALLPVSVRFGRMLVEAEKLGVVDDILTIAAIFEQGGITTRPKGQVTPLWKRLCYGEYESDIMAQLSVFKQAERMSNEEMVRNGIFIKSFYGAKQIRHHLKQALYGKIQHFASSGDRQKILRAVCAGMVEHLYAYDCGGWKKEGATETRTLAKESVVRSSDWVIGIPFDLQLTDRFSNPYTLRLLQMVTKVNPTVLMEIAPHLVRKETGINPRFDPRMEKFISTTKLFFNGELIREEREVDKSFTTEQIEKAKQTAKLRQNAQTLTDTLAVILRDNFYTRTTATEQQYRHAQALFKSVTADTDKELEAWIHVAEELIQSIENPEPAPDFGGLAKAFQAAQA